MSAPAQTVAYCHCRDCRRWTGGPVAAFAAFDRTALTATPPLPAPASHSAGVERWNCTACGSPLAAQFDYLPTQVYVPLGILDQIDAAAPQLHCHAESAPRWLHIADDLPRQTGSARDTLSDAAE
ncbi:GFA family protein [uncultured Tateyamaria sp.]|uniref:GFA family protein n=1 Tax=uncultured Tateyamaria sp. TaxID=455651 RepID=UPI00262075E1|nr:GFA family protein [uncultured Tateyamaria sp.]